MAYAYYWDLVILWLGTSVSFIYPHKTAKLLNSVLSAQGSSWMNLSREPWEDATTFWGGGQVLQVYFIIILLFCYHVWFLKLQLFLHMACYIFLDFLWCLGYSKKSINHSCLKIIWPFNLRFYFTSLSRSSFLNHESVAFS